MRETLEKLSSEELVSLIVQQQETIQQQQRTIEELQQEIEHLKLILAQDSQTSSKPPSTDLLKKQELPKELSDSR